jgi:hypothetical protein
VCKHPGEGCLGPTFATFLHEGGQSSVVDKLCGETF